MLRRFDVHRVTSVAEAVALRQRFGEDAAIYAGGTELLLAMKMGVARWPHLIDVKPIGSLAQISASTDTLRIGATATHWDIERNPLVAEALPALAPDEVSVAIEIPLPGKNVRAAYVKFQILERPSVGVAALGTVRDGRFVGAPTVVVGAVDEMARPVPTAQFAGADARDAGTL